jgi:demethylmenaquinone methyltransferase/2-methoxy-6-polyprenyl-1,4-benzoquinol methylase
MSLGAIIVSIACLNAWILTTSRLPYAMAKDRLVPGAFGEISSRFRTPTKSLAFQAVFAFFIAVLGTYMGAVLLLMANALILYALCAIAVIKLKKKPIERTVNLPVIVPIIALAICVILLTQIPPALILSSLIIMGFGVPAYVLVRIKYDRKFVENLYNRLSFFYDALSPFWYGSGKREKVIVNASVKKGDIVLDYGCATGADIPELSRIVGKTGKIVAVDISVKQLEKGVRKAEKIKTLPNVAFVKEEENIMPFEPDTFDVVLSVGVLSFQEDPSMLIEMFRKVLKHGGRLSILEFGRVIFFPAPKYLKSDDALKGLFKKAGFKDVNIERVGGLLFEYFYIMAKR